MLLIENGRVVDPVTERDEQMDVLIRDGRIVSTGKGLGRMEGLKELITRRIDASGLVVSPGLMDAHVHFRDPGFTYKEDILTGAAAAADAISISSDSTVNCVMIFPGDSPIDCKIAISRRR